MMFKRCNFRIICVERARLKIISENLFIIYLLNVDLLVFVKEMAHLNRSQNPQEKKAGLDMMTVTCPSSSCSFDTLHVYS